MSTRLNIVVAHNLEAKFPIQWLGLQQVGNEPKQYADNKGLYLIVSGEGQRCSADAVDYLASHTKADCPTAWLNFGIAGHRSLPLGAALVPDKIGQKSSGNFLYPAAMLSVKNRGLLLTVDKPEQAYPEDGAYDMEAYGFWQSAIQHASLELVQCLKIVSDNSEQPVNDLNLQMIENLLEKSESVFLDVVEQMQSLLAQCPQQFPYPGIYAQLLSSGRFSATQQLQLKRLLQRYHALDLYENLQRLNRNYDSARLCIHALQLGLQGKL